jgi:cytosine/uracil/thiamine/allantoin permease
MENLINCVVFVFVISVITFSTALLNILIPDFKKESKTKYNVIIGISFVFFCLCILSCIIIKSPNYINIIQKNRIEYKKQIKIKNDEEQNRR